MSAATQKTSILLTADDRTRGAFASATAGLGKLQAAGVGVQKVLGAIGIGAGIGLAGLATMVRGSINDLDDLAKASRRAGLAAQDLAGLRAAYSQAGGSVESLRTGLDRLNVQLGAARQGAAAQSEMFRRLGVDAGGNTRDTLLKLADTFERLPNAADRAKLATELFGRSAGPEMSAFLGQGRAAVESQIDKFGKISGVTDKAAQAAEKFNDSLDTLGRYAKGAAVSVAGPLVIAFNSFADAAQQAAEGLTGASAAMAGLGQAGIVGQTIGVVWANVAFVLRGVGTEIGGIAAQIAALGRGDLSGAGAIGKMMREDARKARDELDALEKRIMGFKPTMPAANESNKRGVIEALGIADLADLSGNLDADAKRVNDALRKAFDIAPLDQFIAGFDDRARTIKDKYAQLAVDLKGGGKLPENVGALDLESGVGAARTAFASGDTKRAEAEIKRVQDMLRKSAEAGGPEYLSTYYARVLEQLETEANNAARTTAETTRDALLRQIDDMAAAVAEIEPVHVPIAADAIATDIKNAIEQIRKDLQSNPIVIPTIVQSAGGSPNAIRDAALKLGSR